MFDLSGRNAVVTGLSRGIGQAIAIALAEAGANVAGIDQHPAGTTEQALVGAGADAILIEGSTSDPAAVEDLAASAEAKWGSVDIWVNNAAQLLVRPFLELADEDWHATMSTNLDGYRLGCRAALRRMIAKGFGRIINVTSVTVRQPISGLSAYVSSKGAVLGLTRVLALEAAPHGVTVNALAPGAVKTPLTAESYTEEVEAAYRARIALGRVATASDVAGAAVFLASDEAGYITGHELLVDGGLALNGDVTAG